MSSCCDGFRLSAPSECSLRSKARIDALFDDNRSMCSSAWAGGDPLARNNNNNNNNLNGGCCNLSAEVDEEEEDRQQRRVNSAVQARIEAMFAKVEAESAAAAAVILPVKYMGATPVGSRVASVQGLQEPLRQLTERIGSSVNAELEVSRRGLTFRTNDLQEKNNPFRRIAVWSSLKLQAKRRHGSPMNGSFDWVYAFVPLVADGPASSTSNIEDRHAELFRKMHGLEKNVEDYPPIFAVVMRRPGAARLLECHAFACRCEEDAVAAAATLYRALLADLEANARRPRQKNGLGCVSLASVVSSARDFSPISSRRRELCTTDEVTVIQERMSAPPPPPPPPPPAPPLPTQDITPPIRPPRSKKSSMSSSVNTEDEQNSAPSPCKNMNIPGKNQRYKKNNLENMIKSDDVFDRRGRKLMLPSRINEDEVYVIRTENNSSSASSRLEQSNEEMRMNAKNKIYGSMKMSQGPISSSSSSETRVIEKIYEDRKPRSKIIEAYNENEKSSSDRERNGLYNFNCCLEKTVFESSCIYAKARLAGSKCKSEQKLYEVSSRQAIGCRSASSSSMSSRDRPPPGRPESAYAQHQRRRGSSVLGRPDPFRDVDKIYRLEEICGREGGIYNITPTVNRPSQHPRSDHSDHSSKSRLSRVSTMDRRIRSSRSSRTSNHQQQKLHHQQTQSRQRRRSRAGSEPPIKSRTETTLVTTAAVLTKRSQSDLELVDHGDLMTRVELPRRSSFLKPGSVRKREGPGEDGGRTPLGFSELFDEFRNQEGLTSVDDILAAIIDPEGMSFNDLKPLYKEFLLKLAATLTQDELYQRSASIMRRRRRPQRRRSSRNLLRRAIKRSVSRLRNGTGNAAPTEFTSVLYPARRLNERNSFGSSSSCDATKIPNNGHKHNNNRVIASKVSRRRNSTRCSSSKSRLGCTTSEDSDTCRRMGRSMLAANRSSSGYVSCSECSYDSESCTCVSADKCYCSLSRKSIHHPQQAPVIPCGCDTDSCSESNKCYCARKPTQEQPSILEQLRLKGIVPAESTLSRGGSPERRRSRRASKNLTTSKSLEYLQVRPTTTRNSTDNLALDYDLFSPGNGEDRRSSRCSSSSEKVLVVSARDPQGRLIYVGGAGSERPGVGRDGRRASRHCREGRNHHEALSIKKSAEIAAVFTGNGTTRLGRRSSSTSSIRSSVSLEAALGYFP